MNAKVRKRLGFCKLQVTKMFPYCYFLITLTKKELLFEKLWPQYFVIRRNITTFALEKKGV